MILNLDLDCFFTTTHRINNLQLDNILIAVGGRSNLNILVTEKTRQLALDASIPATVNSQQLVTGNSRQQDDEKSRALYRDYCIKRHTFSSKTDN